MGKLQTGNMEEKIQELEGNLAWYNLFVDYVYKNNRNLYNEACEYSDEKAS